MLLTLSVSYPFLSLPHFKPQSEKLDGPVAAGKFYGPVAPAVSLKILHGPRPSLKYAFSGTDSKQGPTTQQIPKKHLEERSAQHISAVLTRLYHKNLCREHSIARTINRSKLLLNQSTFKTKKVLPKENSLVSFPKSRIYIHVCFHSLNS